MLHVLWLCHQACRYYQNWLTARQLRNLLIAALFHDFDHPGHPHPGERDPDRINIPIAIAGLRLRRRAVHAIEAVISIEPPDRSLRVPRAAASTQRQLKIGFCLCHGSHPAGWAPERRQMMRAAITLNPCRRW